MIENTLVGLALFLSNNSSPWLSKSHEGLTDKLSKSTSESSLPNEFTARVVRTDLTKGQKFSAPPPKPSCNL